MPLHDYECKNCGYRFESIVKWDEHIIFCPQCNEKTAKRVYDKFKGLRHDAPAWLKKTVEIVDKEGDHVCQEFIKHPTRANYHRWMKHKGLRPLEPGEKVKHGKTKEEKDAFRKAHFKKVMENFKKRESISIGAM